MTSPRPPQVLHRRRIANALLLLLGVAWLFFGALSAGLARPKIALVHAWAALAVLGLWYLTRATRRQAFVRAQGGAAVSTAALFGIALFSGQGDSLACWYLPLVPMFVAQIAGWRSIFGWGAIGFTAIGAEFALERYVIVEPEHIYTGLETQLGAVSITLLALGYAAFIRRVAERQLEEDQQRRDKIFNQAEELAAVHEELEQAHEIALGESRSKSRLMARVSHEIRTPLNGLLGLSEVLADAPLEPMYIEMVRSLRTSASALRQLVDDLLDVTRIQDGRVTLHTEATELRELIGDVLDTFSVLAERKGVGLAGVVSATVPERLSIDALRLRQVTSNLVANALKFTETGEVSIRVGGKVVAGGVFKGRIEVTDTGPGIDPEILPRLFEEYEQADDDKPLKRQGTGLGLYISRELVRALGGELGASSAEGRGSVFHFTFQSVISGAGPGLASGVQMMGSRVVAADPHPASREALVELAGAEGFELEAVPDVAGLAAVLEDNPARIVIVDAAFGDAATLKILRRVVPSAKVILARGAARLGEPLPSGYAAMTLKPYRASRLRSVLMDVLPDDPASQTAADGSPALRCLVVDDDETNRMVARLLLERAGQTVTLADDTTAAEKIIRGGEIDALFQDVQMPGEDGLSFVRRLRKDFDTEPSLWVIAHSAATSDRERRTYVSAGMDDFLAKPIEVGLLRAALERADRAIRRRRRKSVTSTWPEGVPAVLDTEVFDKLARDLAEDMGPLVHEFVTGSAQHVIDFRRSVKDADRATAHRAMHTLSSSSALLGAVTLAELTKTLEKRLEKGRAVGPSMVSELRTCRDSSVELIRDRFKELARRR